MLAALFALIALLIVGNMLVSSVRRRCRELAVLRTMGFVRRQVSAVVIWQATMLALVALVAWVAANVIAIVPGLLAARTPPARILRTE